MVRIWKEWNSFVTSEVFWRKTRSRCKVRRIALGKEAFSKKRDLMRSTLTLQLKKCMVKAFVWSVVLYMEAKHGLCKKTICNDLRHLKYGYGVIWWKYLAAQNGELAHDSRRKAEVEQHDRWLRRQRSSGWKDGRKKMGADRWAAEGRQSQNPSFLTVLRWTLKIVVRPAASKLSHHSRTTLPTRYKNLYSHPVRCYLSKSSL